MDQDPSPSGRQPSAAVEKEEETEAMGLGKGEKVSQAKRAATDPRRTAAEKKKPRVVERRQCSHLHLALILPAIHPTIPHSLHPRIQERKKNR
ncbi:hypothetical protein COCNU_scaffold011993G000020 [Cocos nucifera]|nr:hypothetical protein [Cocos nucifera]